MPTDRPTVFLRSLENGHASAVAEGLEQVGFFGSVPANGTVFLKPNLTFPEFRPGVMTSVDCIRAVAECLTTRGFKVIIGEADGGGYNRFSMDAVFEGLGIHRLCAETGARCLNISFTDPEILELKVGWRTLRVPVPRLLLDGSVDAFITLPVPKIHMNSMVSMSIKNQWGCIQEPKERLKLHPFLSEVMFEFNRRLPRAYSIIDGRWGLNRSGPMRGDLVDLNWLLVANDLVAADRVCCRIMQVDEQRVKYLRHFQRQGWWSDFSAIQINTPLENFQKEQFYLRREWTDLPGVACFNSPFLAWLGYHSPLASFAHWLLYLFREPFYDAKAEQVKLRNFKSTDQSAE
jgi:uncharacterized protein (DUF362 family)